MYLSLSVITYDQFFVQGANNLGRCWKVADQTKHTSVSCQYYLDVTYNQ